MDIYITSLFLQNMGHFIPTHPQFTTASFLDPTAELLKSFSIMSEIVCMCFLADIVSLYGLCWNVSRTSRKPQPMFPIWIHFDGCGWMFAVTEIRMNHSLFSTQLFGPAEHLYLHHLHWFHLIVASLIRVDRKVFCLHVIDSYWVSFSLTSGHLYSTAGDDLVYFHFWQS